MNEAAIADRDTAATTPAAADAAAFAAASAATAMAPEAAAAAAHDTVQGRSAFHVDVSGAGLVVHTVFAADDGRVLPLPAVFPDVHYALEQIDALRRLVVERFAQAAQVGAQLIAAQRARAAATPPQPAAAAEPSPPPAAA